jgi:hypothetical protein
MFMIVTCVALLRNYLHGYLMLLFVTSKTPANDEKLVMYTVYAAEPNVILRICNSVAHSTPHLPQYSVSMHRFFLYPLHPKTILDLEPGSVELSRSSVGHVQSC